MNLYDILFAQCSKALFTNPLQLITPTRICHENKQLTHFQCAKYKGTHPVFIGYFPYQVKLALFHDRLIHFQQDHLAQQLDLNCELILSIFSYEQAFHVF